MHVNVLRIKEYENMPALAVVKNKANQSQFYGGYWCSFVCIRGSFEKTKPIWKTQDDCNCLCTRGLYHYGLRETAKKQSQLAGLCPEIRNAKP